MTQQRTTPQRRWSAKLTPDQMRAGIDRIRLRVDELQKIKIGSIATRDDYNVIAMEKSIEETLDRVFGARTRQYLRYRDATQLHRSFVATSGRDQNTDEVREEFRQCQKKAIAILNIAINGLEEELAHKPPQGVKDTEGETANTRSRKVFIVHGHDGAPKAEVARFLERIGFQAIILHEQATQTRTVIEKVEAHGDVGFAVILLTPDDEGCVKGGTPAPRARQNVLLELGYFVGKLGRGHVCVLKRGQVETPSDFGGVVYEPFDRAGGWRQALGRELEAAGFEIDWNRAMRP